MGTQQKQDFSYEYRLKHPESREARICNRLLSQLFEQTLLVETLLKESIFSIDDIHNLYKSPEYSSTEDDESELQEIYQWVSYSATDCDLRSLDAARVPYLQNEYGTWIGLTSFGTSWDVYIATELAEALYG